MMSNRWNKVRSQQPRPDVCISDPPDRQRNRPFCRLQVGTQPFHTPGTATFDPFVHDDRMPDGTPVAIQLNAPGTDEDIDHVINNNEAHPGLTSNATAVGVFTATLTVAWPLGGFCISRAQYEIVSP
jgi:hypothetical protein